MYTKHPQAGIVACNPYLGEAPQTSSVTLTNP